MPVAFKISDTEHVLSSYIFKANSILFEFTFGLQDFLDVGSTDEAHRKFAYACQGKIIGKTS